MPMVEIKTILGMIILFLYAICVVLQIAETCFGIEKYSDIKWNLFILVTGSVIFYLVILFLADICQ